MAVSLSSLRVGADFDSSGYVRGAQSKNDADAKMIAFDKARNASLAQADAALAKSIPGVARLSASLLDGYGAGARFEAQIRAIGNAVDRGLGLDRANILLEATYQKFGLTASSAALAQKGFVSIGPSVDQLNSKLQAQQRFTDDLDSAVQRLNAAQRVQATINASVGIGANDNSAGRAADIAALGQSLDTLRAKYSPLYAAQQQYLAALAELNGLEAKAALTETERSTAITRTKSAFAEQVVQIRGAASATGLASYQMTNLGYQVNDIVSGLAMGQSPFTILAQQGGQLQQILSAGQGGVAGSLKGIGVNLLGMVTPTRAAFGAVVAGVGLAISALASYEGKINEVQRQLSGIGRASGASANQIDTIGQTNASPTGLSTNEARNMAAALAATGKVGVGSIGPIVALGHDFAKTFGVDAKEATDILAKAFADPARGADELNQRLGFLDANTKLLIDSLVTQGNRTEAVRILTDKIKESIASAADITSFWSRAWTATGNTMSDFFDRVGRGADRVFNGGSGINEQIGNLTLRLISLQKEQMQAPKDNFLAALSGYDLEGISKDISDVSAQIEVLRQRKAALDATPTPETRDKQRGLEIDAIARAMLPTIDATRKLDDETKALNEAFARPELQQYVSVIGGDLVLAFGRYAAARKAIEGADPIKNQIADSQAQIAALDQRSISDRARLARETEIRRQSLDPNAGDASERLTKQNQAALLAAGGQTALDNVEKKRIGKMGSMADVIAEAVQEKQEKSNDRDQRRMPAAA